jgi:hypothetical protein
MRTQAFFLMIDHSAGLRLCLLCHAGLLVGAGSTSHVYRGAWANTDVAVKLIPFDPNALSNPEQQLQQLTTLNHPNLVRTYCGVICTRQRPTSAAASARQQQRSSLTDSAQQLEGQDAPKAPGSSSGRDQEPQQLFVLTGSSPSALGLQASLVSPTSSMASAMSPVGISANAFRVSDSSGMVMSPTADRQQQRPGRASASSLAAEENEAEAWLVQVRFLKQGQLACCQALHISFTLAVVDDVAHHQHLLIEIGAGAELCRAGLFCRSGATWVPCTVLLWSGRLLVMVTCRCLSA